MVSIEPLGIAPLFLAALLAPAAAQTGGPEEGPDIERARRLFAEARAVSDADGGALWGVELYGPMLFVDPVQRVVLANEQVADGEELAELGGVFFGPQPARVFAANAAQEWGGKRWTTIVLQAVPNATYGRRVLLAHEMFHRVQPELGFVVLSPGNAHLETTAGRVWLRLELRALSEALLRRGAARRAAAADALLFRARRHALFEGAAEEERLLELGEGLPQYTGLRASTLPAGARDAWAAGRIADEESSEGAGGAWMLRRLEGKPDTGSFTRSFAYMTGAAYGLLLDDFAAGWRGELDAASDLAAMLRDALADEPPGDLVAAADERSEAYQGWIVAADEERRAAALERKLAAYRARLVDAPVLRLPFAGRRQISFKSPDLTMLPGEGRVYERVDVATAWGTLRVESGGALSHLEPNGTPTDIVVPAPADPLARPVTGAGWTLELAPGWTLAPGERPGDFLLRAE